ANLLAVVGGCYPGPPPNVTTGLMATAGGVAGLCPRAQLVPFKMSLGEGFFHSIADPNVAFLLINIGFLALIAWIFHPGFHVSLAVGVIAEVIGLAILETLPVELTGFILLLVSAVLFVLDVKARAHGVLTAGGIATLLRGGVNLVVEPAPEEIASPEEELAGRSAPGRPGGEGETR